MKRPHRLALALGLALLTSTILAPSAGPKAEALPDTNQLLSTMPVLRKVLPALYAPGSAKLPARQP